MTYDARTRDRYRGVVIGVSGAVALGVVGGTAALAQQASREYVAAEPVTVDAAAPAAPVVAAPAEVIEAGPVIRKRTPPRPTGRLAATESTAEAAPVVVRPAQSSASTRRSTPKAATSAAQKSAKKSTKATTSSTSSKSSKSTKSTKTTKTSSVPPQHENVQPPPTSSSS